MQPGLKCVFIVFLCGICCISVESRAKNGDYDTVNFVLVKKNNGIMLYERWFTLKPNQLAREIKATFSVRAGSDAAVALIKDETRGRKWNKNTQMYKILPENENIWFGYIQYDLPWPVSNQDCVLQYNRNDTGNSLQVDFKGTDHPSFPIQERIHRIPEISGKWVFTESDNGINVEYYISTTPSATLPSWLTDPIIRNNLIETLQVFRSILEGQR